MTSSGELELLNMDAIWDEFAIRPAQEMSLAMGQEKEKTQTVCLSDYYDAVPLYIDFRGRIELAGAEKQQSFEDYFYIPMPEGVYVTYTLTKNDSGGVNQVDMTSEQQLCVTSRTARSDRGWLIVMDGWVRMAPDAPAQRLDFSQVKGGIRAVSDPPSDTPEKMDAWDGSLELQWNRDPLPHPGGRAGMDVCLDGPGAGATADCQGGCVVPHRFGPGGPYPAPAAELGELGRDNKVLERRGAGEAGAFRSS